MSAEPVPASAAAAGPAEDAARLSAAIRAARVICIVGVVYAHAWTGLSGDELVAADGTAQGALRWGLMEVFGRSAVPLLGMISGWLAAGSVKSRSYAGFVAGRARTILAPMVLWNALAIGLVSGAALVGFVQAPVPVGWADWVNELTALFAPNDINVQMPFLRDLFVCMLAAPLLAKAPRRLVLALAGGAAAWTVSGVVFPLLLRPSILTFFALGMLARRAGLAARVAAWPVAVFAAPFAVLALAGAWLGSQGIPQADWRAAGVDLGLRFAAAGLFWTLSWRIAARPWAAWILRVEPYAFLLFCAHVILIWLAGPWIGRLTGPLGSPAYPLFLIAQPALALAATIALGQGLVRLSPRVAKVLSGGRLA